MGLPPVPSTPASKDLRIRETTGEESFVTNANLWIDLLIDRVWLDRGVYRDQRGKPAPSCDPQYAAG